MVKLSIKSDFVFFSPGCPVGRPNIYLIHGECFAFDKTKGRNKDDTKVYCSSVFGSALDGRIHEPRSRSVQRAVLEKWNAFAPGHNHWLGITDNHRDGTWRYDSDNGTIAFSEWYNGQPNGGTGENCAFQGTTAHDYPCDKVDIYALCDLET